MKTCEHLQTMAVTYAELCQGEDPWIALGNFMNDWFDYATSPLLEEDPIRQKNLHERLVKQTPEPFTRRNIYCGNRMFANKYELAEQFQLLQRRSA
ncbi:MAG: hypothetical protein ABI456_04875 [Ktedonobacteraceae bacterium]